jgi:citrate synthase
MNSTLDSTVNPGLEGVVAAKTRLSQVDGQAGILIIGGFPVETLAANATFEEVLYLLWHDELPSAPALAGFKAELAGYRPLSQATLDLLRAAATAKVPVMDALRMGASTVSLGHAAEGKRARQDALIVVATFPTIVAAYWRLLQGLTPLAPRAELGHAANYLYMLSGETPSGERVRGLETYLNTVIDHGLNASTFTARVIISTQSDMVSAIVGALGALKGPLHGGAPGPALDMVFEIGQAERAEAYLRAKLERGERLMGFGHRVYKVRDPRAEVLATAAARFYQADGNMALYELVRAVEETAVQLLAEYKPGRNLQTNVEFYTALLLHGLDLSTELFTPTFAVGRVGGWTAHAFEQQALNRLIRPQSIYSGPTDRSWLPLEARRTG